MASTLKERMRNTLDDLSGKDFKRFKHKLRDLGRIKWSDLEKADTDDTVDKMVHVYKEEAGSIMVTILKEMEHNQLATALENELIGKGGRQRFPNQAGGGGGGGNVNITAHSGGMVNAPSMAGCNFGGPVSFNYGGAPKN